MESATKWLSGHSDVIAGRRGGAPRTRIAGGPRVSIDTGGIVAPFAPSSSCAACRRCTCAWTATRSRQQTLARHLEATRPCTRWPGPACPATRRRPWPSGSSAPAAACWPSTSARVRPRPAFIDALRLPPVTATLGSVVTYAVHPPTATHRQLSAEQLAATGIPPGLVRISVGLEDVDDLLADMDQALAVATGTGLRDRA